MTKKEYIKARNQIILMLLATLVNIVFTVINLCVTYDNYLRLDRCL